jgi:hypothetical protein
VQAFAAAKQRFDPLGLFSNQWWRRYGPHPIGSKAKPSVVALTSKSATSASTFQPPDQISVHRADSFVKLFGKNNPQRHLFREQFLEEVFNVIPSAKLFSVIMQVGAECLVLESQLMW